MGEGPVLDVGHFWKIGEGPIKIGEGPGQDEGNTQKRGGNLFLDVVHNRVPPPDGDVGPRLRPRPYARFQLVMSLARGRTQETLECAQVPQFWPTLNAI